MKFAEICRRVLSKGVIEKWRPIERALVFPYITFLNDIWTAYVKDSVDRKTGFYRQYPHMTIKELLEMIYVKDSFPQDWETCHLCVCSKYMRRERALEAYNYILNIEEDAQLDIEEFCRDLIEASKERIAPIV